MTRSLITLIAIQSAIGITLELAVGPSIRPFMVVAGVWTGFVAAVVNKLCK